MNIKNVCLLFCYTIRMTILLFNFINILCPFFLAEGGGEDEEGVGMVYF